jgi:very-short-patch-repair endonuclease
MHTANPTGCRLSRHIADKVDNRPDLAIAELAAEQWGVLSLAELRRCGVSRDGAADRVRNGRLHRIHRGVFAVGHANLPLEGRFLAAVKACGDNAVLSHLSAAALWGFVPWDDRHPEVTVPGTATRRHARIRVHRSRTLRPEDITRHRSIPITSPARTLLDLSSVLRHDPLRRAVRQAQSLRLVSPRALLDVAPRSGQLARILATGPAPTRSELEDAVLDLILQGGLQRPDVNVPLVLGGRRVIPDFRWPAQHLVVEADGAAWHDHRLAREDDAERQAFLEAHGERVVRVTWEQAIARRSQTLARIRAAGAPRVRHPAATEAASCASAGTAGGEPLAS